MVDLSIAIQHTPDYAERRLWVQSIIEQLREEKPSVPVKVIEDTRGEGCWPTYLRALEATTGASHHLVLQDDLALCRDFITSVMEVIRARPGNLVALYTNSRLVFTARHRRESWVEKARVACPAVIWPNKLIGEFVEWQSAHVANDCPWDDGRVSMWLVKTSKRAFATVPSLAQHLGCQASILGLNSSSKTASWYIGSDRSALGIDWSQGLRSPAKDRAQIQAECWQYFQE